MMSTQNNKEFKCPHQDCIYRNEHYRPLHACDYAAKTGRTRTRKDRPADTANCREYKPRPALGRRRAASPSEPLWSSLARGLYFAGHTDAEIAELCGRHEKTIGHWRRKLGYEPHRKHIESRFDWSKAAQLYAAGKCDREIAEALGCTHTRVCQWRKENDLPPRFGAFGKAVEP